MNRQNIPQKGFKVVIVGAGGTGLVAAVAALQTNPGIEVTVLEQNPVPGGVTAIATGTIRACDSKLQKDINRKGVTKEDAIKQYLETGGNMQDPNILNTFVSNSGPALDWLVSLGCKIELFNDFRHNIVAPSKDVPGGAGMVDPLFETAKKLGAKFLFETRATDLIMKNNKAAGVKALNKEGKVIEFAADAVILTDGGFWGAKKGEFDKDIPSHLREVIIMSEGSFPQGGAGDGIRMAEKIGAKLENMDMVAYTAQRYVDGKGNLCPMPGSATIWSEAAAIILNQDLQRFVNEDLCFAKETLTDKIAEELTKRHEKWIWNIYDNSSRKYAYRIDFWIKEGLVEQGFLITTLDRYNSDFDKNLAKDSQFGRDIKRERMHPIKSPPFFAMRAGVQANNRRGGVATDTSCRALNKEGKPIPGLYVGGSSMNAVAFDGTGWLSGTGLTSCAVWGKIAGESAARGI
jgi:succinate dehydrogenase/fumarate reductase flavoprotein subunit